jgi:NAD(P)-dependent dehydrogenase (short-subunit alcohol dehydrogenase family)
MKIALITGGSRGLGRSMATHLADKGCDIILTYRERKDEAEKVVREIAAKGRKAVTLQLDLEKPEVLDAFAATVKSTLQETWKTGQFDYLINNGGMGVYASIAETTPAQFDALMNVHLKSPFFLVQKLAALVNDGGHIINISSGLARFSYPNYAAYAMMKGGIEVFTRFLAQELGARKIAVNTIAPGAIETDFGGGVVRDTPALNQMIASQTALGRVGLPDDIGSAVAALLTQESCWINAQRIEVAGGIHL